jgi:two-component sensor histidine kinase/PAS domain-containing protein
VSLTPPATRLAVGFHAAARICAASVVALGIAVLIGWVFDVTALRRVLPNLATMKANTALLFTLLGVALLLAEDPNRRTLRTGLGLFVATVATLTLLEICLGVDFGIDELLVRDLETLPPSPPGRMAIATAVNFVLLGLAVAALGTSALTRIRQAAVLVASGVAFVAICGYVFNVHSRLGPSYTTVALHTAVGFLLVTSAYALAHSQHFVEVLASETVAGRLLRRLLPIMLVLPMLVGRLLLEWQAVGRYDVEFAVSIVVLLIVLSLESVAWLVGHRLYLAERDAHAERTRAEEQRSSLVAELRHMTQELEQRVEARTRDLREREIRYRALFDESPVALWEQDYSAALAFLRESVPVQQIRERLTAEQKLVEAATTKVRTVDANRRGVELFGADGLSDLAARWHETLGPESHEAVADQLLALLDGRTHFETECVRRTLAGLPVHVCLQFTALPAAGTVIVSMVDITASKEAERQLRDAVVRQEVLLREIHHRVKNNLAVIASLFYLASTYITDATSLELLEDSRRRIRSMALVHETLYGSDNLARIDMAEYTRILANEVMAAYRPLRENVQLSTDLQPVSLSVDQAVPCGLILNELMSNAFKHAFPNGHSGVVHVSLWESGGDCIMCVTDNGVGLPADLDIATHHSLGLRLVRLLVAQLGGVVNFERRDRGTQARVTFTRRDHDCCDHDRSNQDGC